MISAGLIEYLGEQAVLDDMYEGVNWSEIWAKTSGDFPPDEPYEYLTDDTWLYGYKRVAYDSLLAAESEFIWYVPGAREMWVPDPAADYSAYFESRLAVITKSRWVKKVVNDLYAEKTMLPGGRGWAYYPPPDRFFGADADDIVPLRDIVALPRPGKMVTVRGLGTAVFGYVGERMLGVTWMVPSAPRYLRDRGFTSWIITPETWFHWIETGRVVNFEVKGEYGD